MNRRRRRQLERLRRYGLWIPVVMFGLWYGGGLLFPSIQQSRFVVELSQSPETLWSVLTDLDAMPTWRAGLRGLERLPAAEGRERWLEIDGGGRHAYERLEAVAPTRMVVMAAEPRSPRWVYRIDRTSGGARLEVVEERPVPNPLSRPFVYLFGDGPGRVRSLCRDLERRLANTRPEIALRRS